MIRKNRYFAGAAIGAAALTLAGAGGYWARASAETGAVNGAPTPAAGAPASFADIIQRVAPAVVSIDVEGKIGPSQAAYSGETPFQFQFGGPGDGQDDQGGQDNPFGFDFRKLFPQIPQGEQQPQIMRAAGSGFFISPDGYILTNNHVVQGADKITVHTKDGRELKARLIGRDAATDLAVVKVDGAFPYVSFEDRAKPRVGDWVVAVGNPFGLGGTATAGIVSALGRKNVGDSSYVDYMQIDAPINRGNSGGPTFDMYGRVVGVNTAIFTPSGGSVGIGFDIPADVAASVSRQLIEHGKVVRGYIGATVQDVTPEIADSLGLHGKGALIADLTPGGPSAAAGLEPGDVVVSCDGKAVDSASDLTRDVGLAHAGDAIRLEVLRNGRTRTIDVRSGVRPSEAALASLDNGGSGGPDASADAAAVLGLKLQPDPNGGVAVASVNPNSDAGQKGVRPGDVILQANGHRTSSPSDVYAAVAQARHEGRKDVLMLLSHNGQRLFVPLEVAPEGGQG